MNEPMQNVPTAGERKWKCVYTIVERQDDSSKKLWLRIGTAWVNKDQSLNVTLDAVPTNGKLHIREYQPPEERRGERDGELGDGGGRTMVDPRASRGRREEFPSARATGSLL